MSLATQITALATAVGATMKTLTARVTALEALGSPITAVPIVSGVATVDLSLGDMFTLALTANCTLAFTNPPAVGYGCTKSVLIQQPATGGPYTVALPASFKPITGTDSAIQTAASARTELGIKTYDQGTRWAYVMKGVAA